MIWADLVMSMGGKLFAYICQRVSSTIMHIYRRNGLRLGVNYLDDLAGGEKANQAKQAFGELRDILHRLNIKESPNKIHQPSVEMPFVGIVINTVSRLLKITPERLLAIRQELEDWLNREQCSLKELQSLLGKLHFASQTVKAGRIFVSRMLRLLRNSDGRHLQINEEARKDVKWWYRLMADFDGITIVPQSHWSPPDAKISTDSCLSGCGGWTKGEFYHVEFPIRPLRRHAGI